MLCALSVYSGDADAAQRLLEWIAELGGVNFHTLVLATTQHVNPAPLLEVAQKSWGSVEHFLINMQQERLPWPVAANLAFSQVCEKLKNRGQPFFFLEADCVPIVGNWLDQLEREYHANGKPFMGIVHSTVNPYTGEVMPNSLHMNGAGVYPAHVDRYLPSLPFLMTAMATEPWDMALRHEMMSLTDGMGGFRKDESGNRVSACHATEKICFSWRTKDYRVEDDQIKYDADGPRSHLKPLDFWRHVLHHGCKDGSLIDVLRQRLNPKPKLTTVIVETPTYPEIEFKVLDPIIEVVSNIKTELPLVDASKPRQVAKLKGRRGRPPKNTVVDTVSQ